MKNRSAEEKKGQGEGEEGPDRHGSPENNTPQLAGDKFQLLAPLEVSEAGRRTVVDFSIRKGGGGEEEPYRTKMRGPRRRIGCCHDPDSDHAKTAVVALRKGEAPADSFIKY